MPHLVALWDETLFQSMTGGVNASISNELEGRWYSAPASHLRYHASPPPPDCRRVGTHLRICTRGWRFFVISAAAYLVLVIASSPRALPQPPTGWHPNSRREIRHTDPQIRAGIPPMCSAGEEYDVQLLKNECYFRSHKGSMEYLQMYNNCVTPLRDVMN